MYLTVKVQPTSQGEGPIEFELQTGAGDRIESIRDDVEKRCREKYWSAAVSE